MESNQAVLKRLLKCFQKYNSVSTMCVLHVQVINRRQLCMRLVRYASRTTFYFCFCHLRPVLFKLTVTVTVTEMAK